MADQLTIQPREVAEPSALALMQQAMSAGVTGDTVAVMERLVVLRREMKADEAREAFFRAFVQMQREIKRVKAVREVKNDKGELMYTFAAFEDIRAEADPILEKYGFGVCFDTKDAGDRLVSIFTLIHEGGHSQSNQFAVRYSGPPKTSAAQADASTKTMAMKGAFCDGVGIVISKYTDGSDARVLGDKIDAERAEALRKRVRDSVEYVNEVAFLRHAEAADFEDITEARYDKLVKFLDKADRVRRDKEEEF